MLADFLMPALKIKIVAPKDLEENTADVDGPEFNIPTIRIKLDISDELNHAEEATFQK